MAKTPLGSPITSVADLLKEPGMEPLTFINDIEPITSQPIAALAAQVGEDRNQFLSFLTQNGVERLSDRQFFTNALTKMVRTGRITRGWAKPEPLVTKCSSCQSVPNKGKKLLVCGRCKSAHYCDAKCQKAHWMAGHKATCTRPELTAAEQWAKVDDTGGIEGYRKAQYDDIVGPGGNAGAPILNDGHMKMVNGIVTDIRQG